MTSQPSARRWLQIPIALPPEGEIRAFELGGEPLLLCRVEGRPHVLRDACSHGRTPLSGGRLHGHQLECPLHGGRIDVRDGSPARPPIRRPVRVYATRQVGAAIEVALPDASLEDSGPTGEAEPSRGESA